MAIADSDRSSGDVRLRLRFLCAGTLGTVLVLGSLALGEATAGATPATNLHCGSVVTSSTTLNGTLTCKAYDGLGDLEIEAGGVTLNLGGHTIVAHSSEGGVGVYDNGHFDVTVMNGKIETAFTGVVAVDVTHFTAEDLTVSAATRDDDFSFNLEDGIHLIIMDNTIRNQDEGIDADDIGTSTISNNTMRTSDFGIDVDDLQSTTFSSNTLNNSSDYGYYGRDTSKVALKDNVANNDHVDGVFITNTSASGELVSGNRADDDGTYGFYAANRVAGGGNIDVGDPKRCHNVTCVIP
jgi:hypothetical protein